MARINLSGTFVDVPPGTTILQAMLDAGQHPDSFIYLIGGRPVPMDTVPGEGDEVRAMRVASGG